MLLYPGPFISQKSAGIYISELEAIMGNKTFPVRQLPLIYTPSEYSLKIQRAAYYLCFWTLKERLTCSLMWPEALGFVKRFLATASCRKLMILVRMIMNL
jgi:hypothetical protein